MLLIYSDLFHILQLSYLYGFYNLCYKNFMRRESLCSYWYLQQIYDFQGIAPEVKILI